MKKINWLVTLWLLVACSPLPSVPAQIDPPFPPPGLPGTAAQVYALEAGWFEGQSMAYYNLGTNSPLDLEDPTRVKSSGVWVFATGVNPDGSPINLEGQDNLFDTVVGDAVYTDLWQVYFVTPAAGYAPNSITALDALLASGMTIEKQAMLVNCPFVPAGSALADNALPLKKGWVKGQPVVYFDFGPTSPKPGSVYVFVTGFDAGGNPQLVAGQHFIFDSVRASSGYSDFRFVQWVLVDDGYKADSIRSAKDIDPAKVTASTLVVNYPQK
jgi:hypothetical protein